MTFLDVTSYDPRKQLPSAFDFQSAVDLPPGSTFCRKQPGAPLGSSYALNGWILAAQRFDISSLTSTIDRKVSAEDEVHISAVRCSAGSSLSPRLSRRTVEVQALRADVLHRPESASPVGKID
jgi:hypothetical protein